MGSIHKPPTAATHTLPCARESRSGPVLEYNLAQSRHPGQGYGAGECRSAAKRPCRVDESCFSRLGATGCEGYYPVAVDKVAAIVEGGIWISKTVWIGRCPESACTMKAGDDSGVQILPLISPS